MKQYKKYITGGILAALLVITCGFGSCSTVQAPPSALDRKVFDIQTNYIPAVVTQTNVVYQTNQVTQTNVVTGLVYRTNIVQQAGPPTVVTVTNEVPTYIYTAKPAIIDTVQGAGALGGPYGTLGAAVIAGALGLWGSLKSKHASVMEDVAANSTQALQTARSVITAMPNSGAVTASFNNWLATHQQDVSIASGLAQIVDDNLDPAHHATVAAGIVAQATAPLPVKTA